MTYEVVREIFNLCPRNQMRDIEIEEMEIEDPAAYVRSICPEIDSEIEETAGKDGVRIFDVNHAGMKQRFTFTPAD